MRSEDAADMMVINGWIHEQPGQMGEEMSLPARLPLPQRAVPGEGSSFAADAVDLSLRRPLRV